MRQKIYRLRVPDSVADLIRGLHPYLKKKIKSSSKIILSNPEEGKPLRDELAGLKSFRVSRFRIVYRVRKNVVEIIAIGSRDRIYEETFSLLNKKSRD